MPTLRLYLLGPVDLRHDGQPLPKPPTLKSQSLLAYLALYRENPQPRDRLIDLFWGERPEPKARGSLRTALWHIRRCLPEEGLILSDPHTVQLDPQGDLWLDVDEFESEVSHDDAARLQGGLALYRGDFMDGFYDEWVINERYRFESLFCEGLTRLMVGQEERGEHRAALGTARRLLEQDPLREDAHQVAMRAYCRLGQRNSALEQYRRCRDTVLEELGAEPMAETTELHREILEGRFPEEGVAEAVYVEMPPVRPAPSGGRNPLDVEARAKLVGREQGMAFLDRCWREAEAGRGRLVLVSGEAGLGKTRLVEEFAQHARWQGARVLWGRCYEFERVLPYQPVAEALGAILTALVPSELQSFPAWAMAQVARLVPEVAEERADLPVTPATATDQERARLFEATARILWELCSAAPILVILEDLQWASESTLQLVHYLVRHLSGHQALMVGTFRPEAVEEGHPLRALQQQLNQEGVCQTLRLSPLSSGDVEAMIAELSGAGEAIAPLAERLFRETEGNPFFLTEMVRALFEIGSIHLDGDVWKGDFVRLSEGTVPLPGRVSEAIETRVRRLNETTQEALRVAAVLGREFDFDLLDAVWGRGEEPALEALDDLLRHRLVEEGTGAMGRDYAFTHHKIQEVVYAGIPRRHRQHAHAQAGLALERLYGPQANDWASEVAFHLQEGARYDETLTERAITSLLAAGDRARGMYAHEEAVVHYQGALALLKKQGEYTRAARTLMKLGLTYQNAFDFQAARQAYDEGFLLWEQAVKDESSDRPPPAPHGLRVALVEPATLDPGLSYDIDSQTVIEQLFSGLVELSPEMGVVPDVARSWEMLDEGRKYIFHLRDDVRWSDGVQVTAGDFEYAWKRVLDPATPSQVAGLLYDVKEARAYHEGHVSDPDLIGVRAVDERTLVVELEGPTGYFPYLLCLSTTFPVPRHVVEAQGRAWTELGNLVSNGPFRLVSWQRGESMLLQRNPTYHGRSTGNLQQVELWFRAAEPAGWLQMYEDNRLEVLVLHFLLPSTDWERARQRHAGEYVSVPGLNTHYIGFDVRRAPFDDPRVRRAFTLATDRETLAHVTLRGYVLPATGGFVPPGMPGHSPGIGLPYDPEQARVLLAEAGYPGGQGFPELEVLSVDKPLLVSAGESLQTQWLHNLGIEIASKQLKWGDMLDRLARESPHIWLMGWAADYPDPDNFLRVGEWELIGGWRNELYDRLIEGARRVTDQGERMRMYQQAEPILVQEAPILPLWYFRWQLLVKPWVRKYALSPMKVWFWKDVIIEPH
ncbi:MAG TPA: ABC transporter substrate-binding protein [Anaerolineae bacterium]|nr:ABC transporter substrate-binding protein [Anaerolineae bacterium]